MFKTKYEDIKPFYQVTAKCKTITPPRTETIISEIINEDSFRYGFIEYRNNNNSFKGILLASLLVDLLRNVIPVRVVNVNDKARVIKEGEVLAICAPVTCINRNHQATMVESFDTTVSEILQNAELSAKQTSAAERLLLEFIDLFSRAPDDTGQMKITQYAIDTRNQPSAKQHPRRSIR